jgi:uncharacterized 2Fe-2S/4Fe-4S cluster protein (DUF4445 family)
MNLCRHGDRMGVGIESGSGGATHCERCLPPVRAKNQAKKNQANVPAQLRSSREPARADFSGWNWVANSGPFS